MTTLKVSISNKRDAELLVNLLNKMSFVKEIKKIEEPDGYRNQFDKLQSIIEANSDLNPFSNIEDPAAWEKQMRAEWE